MQQYSRGIGHCKLKSLSCPVSVYAQRRSLLMWGWREAGFKCMFTFIQCECVHDAICYAHDAAASPITEEAANEYLMLDERRLLANTNRALFNLRLWHHSLFIMNVSISSAAPLQPARKSTPKLIDLIAEAMTHLGVKSVLWFKSISWWHKQWAGIYLQIKYDYASVEYLRASMWNCQSLNYKHNYMTITSKFRNIYYFHPNHPFKVKMIGYAHFEV